MTPGNKRLVAGGVVVVIAAVVVLSIVVGRRGAGSPVAATTTSGAPTASTSAATSSPTSSARSSSATAGPSASPTSPATTAPSSSAPAPTVTTAPAPVEVVVTVASWNPSASDVELGAFVQGVVETGGKCVVTMRKGSQQATGQAAALPNAKNTSCGDLRVAGSAVSTGSWTATVTYTSPTSSGTSAPTTIEVP